MDGIGTYQRNSVATKTPGQLIVTLYEGAIRFLKQAIVEIEAGRHAEKGEYVNRAVAIITELNACLQMETGGEIAQNLRRLYNFINRHLNEANLRRDPERIRDVIAVLEDLNEGWKAISA